MKRDICLQLPILDDFRKLKVLFRFQLPSKLAKPSFESYFLLSKEVLTCISVFENEILFAREVFSSNSAFANEILFAKNSFPHRDIKKPSQIALGCKIFIFLRALVRLLFPRVVFVGTSLLVGLELLHSHCQLKFLNRELVLLGYS